MLLDVMIAEKFINKLTAYTDYNVNIMNEKGIIIASRDRNRVGSFHEIAFDILSNRRDVVDVSEKEEFLGVQPGVNLAVLYEGERIGVVGVTGRAEEVRPIALIIKMSMETMLEYEYQRELSLRRQNLKEQFISRLFYESNVDRAELKKIAEKLGYQEKYIRIPILCVPRKETEPGEVLRRIKSGSMHTAQDISVITQDKKVVVFKTLKEGGHILANYKYQVREYLEDFIKGLQKKEECRFYIGTVQSQFFYYQSALGHCIWLENHIRSEERELFFYDYVDDYMKDVIPVLELHKIFHVFRKEFSEKFLDDYVEMVGILKKNNYNLETSSKELFVHKNTVTFRLDKIRNQLNMNPIREPKDREFMEFLYYYLKNR